MKSFLEIGFLLVLTVAIAFVNGGCADVTGGHRIRPETVSFVHSGITTKQDVIENLGAPSIELKNGQLIAYLWETTGRFQASFKVFDSEKGTAGPKQKQWAFCVALDGNARVSNCATISTEQDETISQAVSRWYDHLPSSLPAHGSL